MTHPTHKALVEQLRPQVEAWHRLASHDLVHLYVRAVECHGVEFAVVIAQEPLWEAKKPCASTLAVAVTRYLDAIEETGGWRER